VARRKPKVDGPSRAIVRREAFDHLAPVEFGGVEFPDYVGMAEGYVDAVLSGAVVENEYVVLACKRFRAMRTAATKKGCPYSWSDAHVVEVCGFIERLPQLDGIKKPSGLLTLDPWQCWFLAAIFGFRQMVGTQNVRWVTEVHFDCPRKTGKSALSAGIDLYCFLYEDEGRSQILIGASSRDQALAVYEPIRQFIVAEPELQERFGLIAKQKEIRRPDGGFIRTISAIGRKNDSHNPHVAHIDELHAVSTELHEVMASSLGAKANQLFLKTTTAGDRMFGPGPDARKRAMEVLKGAQKAPHLFTVIYTIDKEDQKKPLTWANVVKAMPNLGVSIRESVVRDMLEKAKHNLFDAGEFITKQLNVYSDIATRAVSAEAWEACARRGLKMADLKGRRCGIGVDIGVADDHTAIVVVFDDPKDPKNPIFFCEHHIGSANPGLSDERVADQLLQWRDDKWLTVHDFPVVDLDVIEARIMELWREFSPEDVVFDSKDSNLLVAKLIKNNVNAGMFKASPVEATEPTRDIIDRANHGLLAHDGNPMLAWNVTNVAISGDELIRFKKDRTAPHAKIDGFAAMVHANASRVGRIQKPRDEKPKPLPFNPSRVLVIPTGGANA